MAREKGKDTPPARKTVDVSKREAARDAVVRNARGSVPIANGRFVTRRDKSLDKLDKI